MARGGMKKKASGPGRVRTFDQVIMSHTAQSDNDCDTNHLQDGGRSVCSSVCTNPPETVQTNRVTALVEAVQGLTPEERAALAAILGAKSGD